MIEYTGHSILRSFQSFIPSPLATLTISKIKGSLKKKKIGTETEAVTSFPASYIRSHLLVAETLLEAVPPLSGYSETLLFNI